MQISSDGGLLPIHLLDKKLKITDSISKVFVEKFIESFKTSPKELILDFDVTDDEIHGHQEGRFFQGYYDHYCFLSMYVFCEDQLPVSYLRPSNIDGAKHSWAILALLAKRFREVWPDVKILFRGDSGLCRHQMLSWCEKNNIYYITGISKNKKLEFLTSRIALKSENKFNRIKEQQPDLFADRTSCHGWCANQFRLLMASAAYIIIERLRALALKGNLFEKAQSGSIRNKLIKIGTLVSSNSRRITVKLSSSFTSKDTFTVMLLNIFQL